MIITKGAAIEAAGIIALQYPKTLARWYGGDFVREAQELYWQMGVIEDAVTAYDTGGVTAMHDATEGGVLGGLFEVAQASRQDQGAGRRIIPGSCHITATLRPGRRHLRQNKRA